MTAWNLSALLVTLVALMLPVRAGADPMRFESAATGNCNSCGMVVAYGEITAETPDQFKKFLREDHFGEAYATLVLDSPGGDVFAAVALGGLLREAGFDTSVGDGRLTITDWEPPAPGLCRGACVFALAGGVNRWADEADTIAVQPLDFRGGTGNSDMVQQINGRLLSYLADMGVDPRILFLADGAGVTERRLSRDEQISAGLISDQGFSPWVLLPREDGLQASSDALGVPQLFLSVTSVTTFCKNRQPYLRVASERDLVAYLTEVDAPAIPDWHLGEMRETGDGAFVVTPPRFIRRYHDDAHVFHEIALSAEAVQLLLGAGWLTAYFEYWHHHDGIAVDIAPSDSGRKMIGLSFTHCLS